MTESLEKSGAVAAPASRAPDLERRIWRSKAAILGERVWEALLWPFLVGGLFLVVSLFDLWGSMPALLHWAALAAFGLALLASLVPLVRLNAPGRAEALRRLEANSGIPHRPATAYEDTLAGSASPEGEELWRLHRIRLAGLIRRLRPGAPLPRNDRLDPFALRLALALVLIVGLLVAGDRAGGRFLAAFAPGAIAPSASVRLDAWVAPPPYTGKPPIVLSDGRTLAEQETFRALTVPANSMLVIRAQAGEERVAVLHATGNGEPAPISPKGTRRDGRVEFSLPLPASGASVVEIGGRMAAKWRFEVIPDQPPKITLIEEPTRTPRGALRLGFRAQDDYGLVKGEARFALADVETAEGKKPDSAEPLLPPPVIELPMPRRSADVAEGNAQKDLTAHPWAGLKVTMTLVAEDAAKQSGQSAPYEMILPEREFTKPLAQAVVEQRKKLVRDSHGAPEVARALDALLLGADQFVEDKGVYLGLRSVYWRLRGDTSREGLEGSVEQLWQIALNIEDGDMPEAERALKEAQDKLKDAIERNASETEIKQAMEEMRQALAKYLDAMRQQAEKNGLSPDQPPQQGGERALSEQDLDKMLKTIEELAKSGAKDMAQKMLSEMKDMLERMQAGAAPQDAEQQRMSQMMGELGDLIKEQQKLLDDTFAASREDSEQSGEKDEFGIEGELNQNQNQPGQEPHFGPGDDGMMWQQDSEFDKQSGGSSQQLENDSPPNAGQGEMGQLGQRQSPGQGGQQGQRGQKGQRGQGGRTGQGPGQQGQGAHGQQGQGGQSPRGRGRGQPTGREGQGQMAGKGGQGALGSRQSDLRQKLNQMMSDMREAGGQPSDQLQGAGEAMGDAEGALSGNNLDRATQQQTLALDRMRQGAQSMADQMMQAMQGRTGPGQGDSRDPLGRPDRTTGPDLGLSVKVPQEIDIQRAREIMDELRKRLGEPTRPPVELDYLERLIRRF